MPLIVRWPLNFKQPQSSKQSIRLTLSEITDKKSCSDLRIQWAIEYITCVCVFFLLLLFCFQLQMELCAMRTICNKIIIVIMLDQPKWLFSDRQTKCIWCNLLRKAFWTEFRLMPWEWPKWIKYTEIETERTKCTECKHFFASDQFAFYVLYCSEFEIYRCNIVLYIGLALETHL